MSMSNWVDREPPTEKNRFCTRSFMNEWLVPFAQQTFQTLAQSSEKGFKIVWTSCVRMFSLPWCLSPHAWTLVVLHVHPTGEKSCHSDLNHKQKWLSCKWPYSSHIPHFASHTNIFHENVPPVLLWTINVTTCLVVLAVKVLILPRQSSYFQHHRDWVTPWPPRDQCPCRCLAWH